MTLRWVSLKVWSFYQVGLKPTCVVYISCKSDGVYSHDESSGFLKIRLQNKLWHSMDMLRTQTRPMNTDHWWHRGVFDVCFSSCVFVSVYFRLEPCRGDLWMMTVGQTDPRITGIGQTDGDPIIIQGHLRMCYKAPSCCLMVSSLHMSSPQTTKEFYFGWNGQPAGT